MALPIPKRHLEGLNLLIGLPDSDASSLLKALESAKITSGSEEMASRIAEKVRSIPVESLRKITALLYGLYHVREFSALNPNDFLRELMDAVKEHSDRKISNDEFPAIRQWLRSFMRIKTLENLSKAVVLQQRYERVFCEAKITSDMRPVFGDDIESTPVGAVISHILKISYHEEGKHRQFYVALDQFDLGELEKAVKRAKAKNDTLENVLDKSDIPRLGI
jgi:hypothetical protein